MNGQRHAPAALCPRERPGTRCTGGWVGHRAGLDRCGKSRPQPGFDPRPLFTSGKNPVPIVQEAGWATGPVWTGAENLVPSGFDPRTVQPVASRYTVYATRPTAAYMFIRYSLYLACRDSAVNQLSTIFEHVRLKPIDSSPLSLVNNIQLFNL